MFRFMLAVFLAVAAGETASAQSLPLPSYWVNQRGSEMKLYPDNPPTPGKFKGVYMNHAAGFKCQNSPLNPPYAVTGRDNGPNVTFTVVWNNGVVNCNSTTVWRGRLRGKTLLTHWVLTGPGIPHPLRGSDVFQLQP